MQSRIARIVFIVVGIIAVLAGALWIGQGSNLIHGSGMSGSKTWLYIGIVVAVVGVVLLVLGLRRTHPKAGAPRRA